MLNRRQWLKRVGIAGASSLSPLFLPGRAKGAREERQEPVRHLATANDAFTLAVADLRSLNDPVAALFMRYIWVTNADILDFKAIVLALNYVSNATNLYRPDPLGRDGLLLVRVDLRRLAPASDDGRQRDLENLLKVWEEFQFDPALNLLITKDTLKFWELAAGVEFPSPVVRKTVEEDVLVDVPEYVKDGKRYNKKWVTKATIKEVEFKKQTDVQVVREQGAWIDPIAVGQLVSSSRTLAPIVSHQYFLTRALSTIKDKGLYATIYGGLYYDLAGIKTGAKKGSDLDVLLESLGIGNVQAGVGFAALFDRLRSDQRAVLFRSKVTGKPRRVLVLNSLLGREEKGFVLITQDFRDQDIDIGTNQYMNLLDLKAFAQEVIWLRSNGMHGFALFDGNGKRVDEVPPDVANDSTIPTPHTQRLQAAIGCIVCHGNEGGLKVVKNDLHQLLGVPAAAGGLGIAPGARERLDIFDDITERNKGRSRDDVLDRLAGLYSGDLERRVLPRARDDYANAILRAAGPWPESKDQTNVHTLSAERVGKIIYGYRYDLVDAGRALAELGVTELHGKKATDSIGKLLAPQGRPAPATPEDPRLAALKAGLSINRPEWDLVRGFAANRLAVNQRR